METELLTEEQITTLYQEKQREDFPQKRLWLGAFYAVLFISGGIAAWGLIMWGIAKLMGL